MIQTNPKPTVLVVEDDEFLNRMYVSKLEREQFNVLSAGDGEVGLQLALTEHPVLILLDLILPKRDGFSVLAEVKRHPETVNIPVIVLTNLSQQEQVEKCLNLGAAECLIKAHFTPSEVVTKVRQLLKL
jgi:DNA-binding response OmpR family regulator